MKRLYQFITLSLVALSLSSCDRQAKQSAGAKRKAIALRFERLNEDGTAWRGRKELAPAKLAIVVVDVWDRHWCKAHTARVGSLAKKIEPFLGKARKLGIHVIFGPSGTMKAYRSHPARLRVLQLKTRRPPEVLTQRELLALPKNQRLARGRSYFPKTLFASRKSNGSQLSAPLPPWS
ncbi:MAG: hypothetical protein P1V97_38580, partial [Planctomycetota bacterium]|nr:hypothetical protein [Planctomycetota bacterium]